MQHATPGPLCPSVFVLKKPHPFQTCDKSAVTIVRQPKDINTDRKPPIKVIKRSTAARKDVTSRTWRPRGVTVFVLVASHQNSNYSSDGVRQERNPLRLISNSQINLVMHLSDNVNPICSHRRTMVILLPFNSGGQITIDSPKKIFYVLRYKIQDLFSKTSTINNTFNTILYAHIFRSLMDTDSQGCLPTCMCPEHIITNIIKLDGLWLASREGQ